MPGRVLTKCSICDEQVPIEQIVDHLFDEHAVEMERSLGGLAEDARGPGEATEADFWRARAIELGADEDEYRRWLET